MVIDLTHAHLWDDSAIGAIDKVVLKYRQHGVKTKLVGVNKGSMELMNRLAVHDKENAKVSAH